MKAFKTLMLLLALGLSAYGQAVNVTANKIKGSATAPSGSCSAQQVQLTTAGVVYVCSSGTWASSGGGTTINGTDGFVPVRTNSTTFGNSAFASNALNSTYLSATSGASGAGLTLAVAGGGTNENLTFAAKGTIGDINITYGNTLYLKRTVAGANSLNWLTSGGVLKGQWGLAETAGSGVIGTAAGDLFFRDQGGAFWFSVDGGITGAAVLDNNGRLIIGTGGTAVAQLSVYSQSTTRPSLKLNMPSGTSGSQEAFGVYDNGTLSYAIHTDGKIVYVSGNTGTTVGAAGGASALPATPTGYLQVVIGGTTYKIPYYAN